MKSEQFMAKHDGAPAKEKGENTMDENIYDRLIGETYRLRAREHLLGHVAGTVKPLIQPGRIFPVEDATFTVNTGSTHALIRDGRLYVERKYCEFVPADDVTIDGMTFSAEEIVQAAEERTAGGDF